MLSDITSTGGFGPWTTFGFIRGGLLRITSFESVGDKWQGGAFPCLYCSSHSWAQLHASSYAVLP
jgi:hypothetical protein